MTFSVSTYEKYAPIRFERSRTYAHSLGSKFSFDKPKEDLKEIAEALWKTLYQGFSDHRSEDGATNQTRCKSEFMSLCNYGLFRFCGSNVFDVTEPLAKSLLNTDVDGVTISALRLPFRVVYIHWGKVDGLSYSDEEKNIEGGYVSMENQRLTICAAQTGYGLYPRRTGQWIDDRFQDLLTFSVDASNPEASLKKVIHDAFEEMGQISPDDPIGFGKIQAALKLIVGLTVNAVLYLTAEPDDVTTDWSGVPTDVALRLISHHGSMNHAKSKKYLTERGYRKIHVVGARFARALSQSSSTLTGRKMPVHVRRAHWRPQVHGPQRSLRKWIYIPATVINGNWGDATSGHIYDVAA